MAFRIKDLLINIVPEGGIGIFTTGACGDTPHGIFNWPASTVNCPPPCPGGTGTGHTWPCPYYTHPCPYYTHPCPYNSRFSFGNDPVATAEQLAMLKAELQKELALVEQQEKLIELSLRPKDLAEIEALEAKLHEALKELERLKSELKSEQKKK